MDAWEAVGAVGSIAAAGIAAWAARQSRSAAQESNAAAKTMADIERDRHHAELSPRFRVTCEPWGVGQDYKRLRVMLLGPIALDHLDTLTVRIRDDQFRRREFSTLAGGPTPHQIGRQIWGPYRFSPFIGPDDARSDETGRITFYGTAIPVGEELMFQIEPTMPPQWATSTPREEWQRQRGTVIRLALDAQQTDLRPWTIPCEIDISAVIEGDNVVTVDVP